MKVASLQPLHRAVHPGADVSAAGQEFTITLIHHLMNCLTEQVRYRHHSNLNCDRIWHSILLCIEATGGVLMSLYIHMLYILCTCALLPFSVKV